MVKDNLITKKRQEGFTIIEVLIVLAIAGLIILIVFLAVPSLQRNSRNTQAKNGAAAIMAALNESVSNNNGSTPTNVTIAANGDISITNNGATTVGGRTQGGYSAAMNTAAPAATGTFNIAVNRKCSGNALNAGTFNRSIAIQYAIESATGTTPQCIDS